LDPREQAASISGRILLKHDHQLRVVNLPDSGQKSSMVCSGLEILALWAGSEENGFAVNDFHGDWILPWVN
jgi:hypothetical protein